MLDPFSRSELLLGRAGMERLAASRVAVFGIGGVGGHAVEALARCGIGALDLIDSDTVSITNINRQMAATLDTVGQYKTNAAAQRIRSIHPDCRITCHHTFFLPENADDFDFSLYDYVIDAIDTISGKITIICRAHTCGTPVISSMGAGNKLDPTAFRVTDIYRTSVCPLARVMRHELKKRGIPELKVVYSEEPPIRIPEDAAARIAKAEPGGKTRIPGSVSFVPSVAGLILAGEVIKDLTGCTGGGK